MNTFVAVVAMTVAALIHFEAIQLKEEEMLIKVTLILLAGVFLVRAEVQELRERMDRENGTGRKQS